MSCLRRPKVLLLLSYLLTIRDVTGAKDPIDKLGVILEQSVKTFSGAFRTLGEQLKDHLRNISNDIKSLSSDLKEHLSNFSATVNKLGQGLKDDTETIRTLGEVIYARLGVAVNHMENSSKTITDQLDEDSETLRIIRNDLNQNLQLTDALKTASESNPHKDCSDWYRAGQRKSGVYRIQPQAVETPGGFDVLCDMETDGGGWTVFQKRGDFGLPDDYFSKSWGEYEMGFGYFNREFWLGNDRISTISNQRNYEMRVDLKHMGNSPSFAKYGHFRVENRFGMYRLHVGNYTGNAGDALSSHNHMEFASRDRGNEKVSRHCLMGCKSAWWLSSCNCLNLNGPHMAKIGQNTRTNNGGMEWHKRKGASQSLVSAQMKIRPHVF